MEDTLPGTDPLREQAEALGELLRDHRGAGVAVMDIRKMNAWTDFFVIATATSDTHLDGLERHIKEFCHSREIAVLRRSLKPKITPSHATPDEWRIIDLGSIVVHLMSEKARAFYDLERLYSH